MRTDALVDRLLSVLRDDVLPLAEAGVRDGNKVFGAAVLRKESHELVVAAANEEMANPLFHGEISCLNRYWALPPERRPAPGQCIFLSTHEPCSMCLSAITWSGLDNFYYLFSYEDTRDEFNIPHDLKILADVFRCADGDYARTNSFWESHYLPNLIEEGAADDRARRHEEVANLRTAYEILSTDYQRSKGNGAIPLA